MRLLRALSYPLGLNPLSLCIVSSFFWTAALSSLILGLLGSLGLGLFTLITLKYLMAVVEDSAHGGDTPVPVATEFFQPLGDLRHLKLAGVLAVLLLCGMLLTHFTGFPFGAWQALLLLVVPALVAVLAVDEGEPALFSPRRLVGIIARIGPEYLVHVVLLAGTLVLASRVYDTPIGLFPSVLAVHYLLVFGARHLGTTLYHKRAALGLHATQAPERTEEREAKQLAAKRARVLGQVYKRRGTDGLAVLHEFIDQSPDPDDARAWAHRSLLEWEQPKLPLAYSRDYLGRLLTANQPGRALEVFRTTREKWAEFYPASPFQAVMLAEAAIKRGDTHTARTVLKEMSRVFPDDTDFAARRGSCSRGLSEKPIRNRFSKELLGYAALTQPPITFRSRTVIVTNDDSTTAGRLRVILGAIALGFGVLIVVVAIVAITSPGELLPAFMRHGGYAWAALSVLMYPLSKRFMRAS